MVCQDPDLIWPKRAKVALSYKHIIEGYVKDFAPYSDYNFLSLWTYDTNDAWEFSFLNDNLVIKFTDYIDGKPFYSFLGKNRLIDTINILIESAKTENLPNELRLIPEEVVDGENRNIIENTGYSVVEDTNNADYIFSLQTLSELKGGDFMGERNHIRKFEKTVPGACFKDVDINDAETRTEVVDLFMTWAHNKGDSFDNKEIEFTAVNRLLDNYKQFKAVVLGMYDQNKLIGYIISEPLENEYVMAAFTKADNNYKGIFQILEKKRAEYFYNKGYKFLNMEQDLGIPGLKRAKMGWHPVRYLKKYTIESKKV